jgi:large subunit ribosomal protein L19
MATSLEKIKLISDPFLRSDFPAFKAGDVIKMKLKVKEADKIRLHAFEGTVIRLTGGGINASFTVRKISFGEGVEKVFPMHSPVIDSIEVVSKGKTKRSKLYYLRGRVGKAAKVKKFIEQPVVA